MKKIYCACTLVLVLSLLGVSSANATTPDELYALFLPETAPHISTLVEEEHEEDGVLVKRVIFRADAETNIDLIYAYPKETGIYPGVLVLHAGGGIADREGAVRWAQAGYVAVAVDIPGLADPEQITQSTGSFLESETRFDSVEDLTSNPLYHGMASVLGGFRILAKHKSVDTEKLGIAAIGWSADLAVLAAGLLGDRVDALYLENGAAALPYGSYFHDVNLSQNPDADSWYRAFDGLTVADRVTAPVFVAMELDNPLFYPSAVEKTLSTIPGYTNRLYAPEVPEGVGIRFFNHVLKDSGSVPMVTFTSPPYRADGAWVFTATADTEVSSMQLYYSDVQSAAPQRQWNAVTGVAKDGQYLFTVPDTVPANADYFAAAFGTDGTLAATRIYHRLFSASDGGLYRELIRNGDFAEGTAFWRADCGASLSSDGTSLTVTPSDRYGSSAYQQVTLSDQAEYELIFSARTDGAEKPIALILQEYDSVEQSYGARRLFRPQQKMTDSWLTFRYTVSGLSGTYQLWFQAGDGTTTEPFEVRNVSLSYQPQVSLTLTQEGGQLVANGSITKNAVLYSDAELLLAVYDPEGRLLSTHIAKPQTEDGMLTFTANTPLPAAGSEVKAFIWQNMIPLAQYRYFP